MERKISAGLILETPEGILMEHPTGFPGKPGRFDIPKGEVDGYVQGKYDDIAVFKANMVRELEEETGLKPYIAAVETAEGGSVKNRLKLEVRGGNPDGRHALYAQEGVTDFTYLGRYPYKKDKDLALFYLKCVNGFDRETIGLLHCDSTFVYDPKVVATFEEGKDDYTPAPGKVLPEIDGFKITKDLDMLFPRLAKTVKLALANNRITLFMQMQTKTTQNVSNYKQHRT